MTKYIERKLGKKAKAYVAEVLKDGHTLASFLLKRYDLNKGTITAYLPENISAQSANQFGRGGKVPAEPGVTIGYGKTIVTVKYGKVDGKPIPHTDFYLASIIKSYLRNREQGIVIMEDDLSYPTDPVISTLTTRMFNYDNELYHYLLKEDLIAGWNVEETISNSTSFRFVGIMSTLIPGMQINKKRFTISSSDLMALAQNVEKIIINAYHYESYLVWTKT